MTVTGRRRRRMCLRDRPSCSRWPIFKYSARDPESRERRTAGPCGHVKPWRRKAFIRRTSFPCAFFVRLMKESQSERSSPALTSRGFGRMALPQ